MRPQSAKKAENAGKTGKFWKKRIKNAWKSKFLVQKNGSGAQQPAFRLLISGSLEELLKLIQSKLIAYTEALQKLPVRHELSSPLPERIRHAVALKKIREMREAMDDADEQSICKQLFAKIPIKVGSGCFSIFQGQLGPISRLGSVSSSISLPAQYATDPLNYEITRLGIRSAKRGDE